MCSYNNISNKKNTGCVTFDTFVGYISSGGFENIQFSGTPSHFSYITTYKKVKTVSDRFICVEFRSVASFVLSKAV